MRLQVLVLCLIAALPLTACKTNPAVPDTKQNPEKNSEAPVEAEEGDRGFDPCLLNSGLAVCKKQ